MQPKFSLAYGAMFYISLSETKAASSDYKLYILGGFWFRIHPKTLHY
jgi:hypothetical protein